MGNENAVAEASHAAGLKLLADVVDRVRIAMGQKPFTEVDRHHEGGSRWGVRTEIHGVLDVEAVGGTISFQTRVTMGDGKRRAYDAVTGQWYAPAPFRPTGVTAAEELTLYIVRRLSMPLSQVHPKDLRLP